MINAYCSSLLSKLFPYPQFSSLFKRLESVWEGELNREWTYRSKIVASIGWASERKMTVEFNLVLVHLFLFLIYELTLLVILWRVLIYFCKNMANNTRSIKYKHLFRYTYIGSELFSKIYKQRNMNNLIQTIHVLNLYLIIGPLVFKEIKLMWKKRIVPLYFHLMIVNISITWMADIKRCFIRSKMNIIIMS